jgi:hypothetical protein
MYKILCRFAGDERLEDTFCDCDDLETAKHFADRWKQGAYTHDVDSVVKAIVVAPCGEVVYEAPDKKK